MATNSAVGQGAVITDAGQVSIQNMNFNSKRRPQSTREHELTMPAIQTLVKGGSKSSIRCANSFGSTTSSTVSE
jgi:hypothetical protein